jgi:hypothetical protein
VENDLARAQHYRHLADAMRRSARDEKAAKRQKELLDLALQYERLADKLIAKRAPDEASPRRG